MPTDADIANDLRSALEDSKRLQQDAARGDDPRREAGHLWRTIGTLEQAIRNAAVALEQRT